MALLVVDPDDASSSVLSELLTHQGFAVARVAAQADVAAAVEHDRPELVLCPYRSDAVNPLVLAGSVIVGDPTLPVAVTSVEPLDRTALLAALRLGVVDVFDLSQPRLARAVDAAIGRGARLARRESDDARMQAATREELRELKRDQRAGRYIQMGMLPPSPMAIDRYRLRHKLYPSLMLSGDFVDYFRITDRHFVFYMADVSGHGASSAFVTVLLKNFSRRLRREYRPRMLREPGEILASLNRELLDNHLDKHVAIFVGVLDLTDNTLAFANGGHFPSAILSDDAGCRFLELAGKPVGLFEGATWRSEHVALRGALMLAMVSDGILEVMDPGPLAEKEKRLLDSVREAQTKGVELWQVLELDRRTGPDDMACLVITTEA
jgi:sigma-B regulation protein RsbU (phosphoserine phosphatase)